MALTSASLLENVFASLDDFLGSAVSDTEGFPVQKHGVVRFVPPASSAWVVAQYHLLAQSRVHFRQMAAGYVGDEVQGTVELTLVEPRRSYSSTITVVSARDAVLAYFPVGGLIPILDFVSGSETQIGSLWITSRNERTLDDGAETGLVQHSVSIETRYLEVYDQPA